METSVKPMAGLFKPYALDSVYYGPTVVQDHILECLPSDSSKAFIITGNSLATKTPVIKELEALLGSKHHAGTFSKISQHAPVAQLDEATAIIKKDSTIDTIISVGGGSPIDSAKALAYRLHEQTGKWARHISIPTTCAAAECTPFAGYTNEQGLKTGVRAPELAIWAIFYDTSFAQHTPQHLFLSTAIRALDHAVETLYHPSSTPIAHAMALHAIHELFVALPASRATHPHDKDAMARVLLACYASLGFLGRNMTSGLGLSHALGYALGSPYGIPHGVTSCMTLAPVMALKAQRDGPHTAAQLARIVDVLPAEFRGGHTGREGDDKVDAQHAADAVAQLVRELGLATNLAELKVDRAAEEGKIVERAMGSAGGLSKSMEEGVRQLVADLWTHGSEARI